MKSIINSPEVEAKIVEAVKKALNECALQHSASDDAAPYDTQPLQVKLQLNFVFPNLSSGNPGSIFCAPLIELE